MGWLFSCHSRLIAPGFSLIVWKKACVNTTSFLTKKSYFFSDVNLSFHFVESHHRTLRSQVTWCSLGECFRHLSLLWRLSWDPAQESSIISALFSRTFIVAAQMHTAHTIWVVVESFCFCCYRFMHRAAVSSYIVEEKRNPVSSSYR